MISVMIEITTDKDDKLTLTLQQVGMNRIIHDTHTHSKINKPD